MLKQIQRTLCLLLCAMGIQAAPMELTDHPLSGKIWDVKQRKFIDEATLIQQANQSNILLLGEIHDNQIHHDRQQQLLRERLKNGARPALMMEQLDMENQSEVAQALKKEKRDEALGAINKLIKFSDKAFYIPLLEIAYDNKLPVIAANASRRDLQPIIRNGYTSISPENLQRLVVEDVWNEARQKYVFEHMGGAHCGKLRDEFKLGLVHSQRLRDAVMVDNTLPYLEQNIVGIMGREHARHDVGTPIYFAKRAPNAKIVSIGFVEVAPNANDANAYAKDSATGDPAHDYLWFSPRMVREDPCANYGK